MSLEKIVEVQIDEKIIKELQIDFKVIKDKDKQDESEIIIYNMSKTTREEITEDSKVTLTAGKKGTEAIIYTGQVKDSKTEIKQDVKTTLRCIDKNFKVNRAYSKTFAQATNEQIILDIALEIGLSVRTLTMDLVQNNIGRSLSDDGIELIKLLAEEGNATSRVKDNILEVKQGEARLVAVIDASTGLIEVPKIRKEDGVTKYNVKTLFDNRIIEGEIVRVISKDGEIEIKVERLIHKSSDSEFITEIEGVLNG